MSYLRLALLIASAAGAAAAESGVKIEIENDWVRVLRVIEAPHERVSLGLSAGPEVVVALTDFRVRATLADGAVRQIAHQAGDVYYVEAARHALAEENSSDVPMQAVIVELKPQRREPAVLALDPVKLDPEHHPVILENGQVRVLRTILEPHLKSPMHEHPHYVVVYLTDLHTTMKLADGKTIDNLRRPGEVAWRDALRHQTENVGEHTAVEIQIELK
jgi:quercetin dioxygenase-like cupin family protein